MLRKAIVGLLNQWLDDLFEDLIEDLFEDLMWMLLESP